MSDKQTIEGLLRELAPQALAVLARRFGSFADAEDAVQEALIKAYQTWRDPALPERPLAWLVRVASRQLIGHYRSDSARRRREYLAASWQQVTGEPLPGRDDSLTLLFMCCHDALTPAAARISPPPGTRRPSRWRDETTASRCCSCAATKRSRRRPPSP